VDVTELGNFAEAGLDMGDIDEDGQDEVVVAKPPGKLLVFWGDLDLCRPPLFSRVGLRDALRLR
jgi:hypothetical protein